MKQTAFSNIGDAKAAALELVHTTGLNYRWTPNQWDEAKDELANVGAGAWGLFAGWAGMPWNPASWIGLDDMGRLQAVQSYWEAVAELAEGWQRDKLPGADKIRATATQAAITAGSEIQKYQAQHPATVAAGGVAGTAEDYGELAVGGAGALQSAAENPRTTLAIIAGVGLVGLALYLSLILPRR